MPQVAFVTTLQPETHYSRYLIGALEERFRSQATLLIYADKDPRNKQLDYENLRLIWTPSFRFPFQIARQALRDKPALVHLQHEINMYGGRFTAILFPLVLLLLRVVGLKSVVTLHSVVSSDQIDAEFMRTFSWPPSKFLVYLSRLFFSILYRSITKLTTRVIVHSQFMGALLEDRYGVPADKIAVIPIGVPSPKIAAGQSAAFDRPWASSLEGKVILYFGYIIRRKGLEYLIEAFQEIQAKYPDHVLVLAGGELDYQREYARSLQEDVRRRRLENKILFTSFIPSDEIEKLFARCEFVVLPYTYSISSSLPLSFAMQYGKPVIATRLGTLAEEVEDGVTGLLVPARDSAALSEAMQRLITDEMLRRRLGEGARERGRQRSWAAVADQTIQIYRAIQDGFGA
jgi:glycosyltransferase involved in cell wall biosynthesis